MKPPHGVHEGGRGVAAAIAVMSSPVTSVVSIPSRGFRGIPWGMMLVGTAMLVPLFTATYFSGPFRSSYWYLFALALAGGYAVAMVVAYSWAPSRIELRADGIHAFYWHSERTMRWDLAQPSRRRFSVWQGWTLIEREPDNTWRHFVLTREQARAVLSDPRLVRAVEATPRVLASLGLSAAAVQ
jgi:hypothetical protein